MRGSALGGLITAGLAAGATLAVTALATTPATVAVSTTAPPAPAAAIVLSATGPDDDMVLYGPEVLQNVGSGDLSHSYTSEPNTDFYAISANNVDPGVTVTCSISVNGQVVDQRSATSSADCQIRRNFDGSWAVET
jgi:hypothetical protein